jgi:hypothetical protein
MLPQFAALEVADADKVRALRNGLQLDRNIKAGFTTFPRGDAPLGARYKARKGNF